MTKSLLALSCAGVALAFGRADAQSLSDAINQALAAAPNPAAGGLNQPDTLGCAALGAGVNRVTDIWQWNDEFSSSPDTVDVTDGDTNTTSNLPAPVEASDGSGRFFNVRGSTPITLDPAVAAAMSEEEFFTFFRQTGVQRVVINRFAFGSFGAGLSGLCGAVVDARTNSNGNSAGAGGFAGGSSSASGRSVSSLSSAREQSAKEKKRKKKKNARNSSYDDGYIRLASNQEGLGVVGDAAGVGPFGVETFVDFRGGYTDIDRDATALESGFDGRALWGQGSLTAELADNLALAGSISYSAARGDFDTAGQSGGANGFRESNITGGIFALAAFPLGPDLMLDVAVGGFYGVGDGDIERNFSTTRQVTYSAEVTGGAPGVPVPFIRQQLLSDDLAGEFDTRNYGFSAAASVSLPFHGFIVTPGVEFTWYSFRQDDYQESVTDAFNNGLALSYSEFKDRWTETRLGGAVSRDVGGLRLEGYGDLVLTGGAATPIRTATFVEDLRPDPYVLSYRVDDLDKAFGVFGLVAAVGIGDGVEAFVGGETNLAHDYLTTRTVFAGIRFRP
jgi:hypothetical protein